MSKIITQSKPAKKSRTPLQFRISDPLRKFFEESKHRVKGIRSMKQYLTYLATLDGYKPGTEDLR